MDNRVLFAVYVCALAGLGLGEKMHPNVIIEQMTEEARKELQSYLTNTLKDIHKVLMGEQYHEVHDFRVDINPKRPQCYYQETDGQTLISVNFECVDPPLFATATKINARGVLTKSGGGEILESIENKRMGRFEIKAKEAGIYAICFETSDRGGSAKLQIVIDIWRDNDIKQFHEQRIGANDTEYETYSGLFQIIKDVAVMRSAISHTRSLLRYDYLTLISNLSRIDNFSMFYVALIIIVCFLQLRIVKKMFDAQNTVA